MKKIIPLLAAVLGLLHPVVSRGQAAAPKAVKFVDFVVDYDAYEGKQIQISGFLLPMGDTLILYDRQGSTNGVFVDPEGMPSHERKFLLTRCGSGCNATVAGTPAQVMMNKGLVATRLVSPAPPKEAGAKPDTNDAATATSPKKVTVVDLLADFDSLSDRPLRIVGYAMLMGDTAIISDRPGTMTTIMADIDQLSRDEKKLLLTKCGSGCKVEAHAKTGTVMMNKGLILSKIVSAR